MTDLERLDDEKKIREAEIERRAQDRKKRHEELAKGDGKKSFFELNQPATKSKSVDEAKDEVPRKDDEPTPKKPQPKSSESVDLNALDYENYEESDNEDDTHVARKSVVEVVKKSNEMAKAMGVEVKRDESNNGRPLMKDRLGGYDDRKREDRRRASRSFSPRNRRSRERVTQRRGDFRRDQPQQRNRNNDGRRYGNDRNFGNDRNYGAKNRFDNSRRSRERSTRSRSR